MKEYRIVFLILTGALLLDVIPVASFLNTSIGRIIAFSVVTLIGTFIGTAEAIMSGAILGCILSRLYCKDTVNIFNGVYQDLSPTYTDAMLKRMRLVHLDTRRKRFEQAISYELG